MYAPLDQLEARYLSPPAACYEYFPPGLRNPHPPAFIIFASPFSYLRYREARLAWLFLSSVSLVLALYAFSRRLRLSHLASLAIGTGSLALPIVQTSLSFGQSSELLALALVGCWLFLEKGADRPAGALLGLASALRFFPIFLLLPLIRKRRLLAASWTVGSFAIFSGIGLLLVGSRTATDFFKYASPSNLRFWIAQPQNVSIVGQIARWLTKNIWFPHHTDMPLVAAILSGVVIVAGALLALRTPARISGDFYWAAVPWMILVVPLSWTHYIVAALPLMVLVVFNAKEATRPPPILWMVGAAAVVIGIPPSLSTAIGHISVVQELLGYGIPVYGLLFLSAADWLGLSGKTISSIETLQGA